MGDLQTLPSSLRESHRYVLFEVVSDDSVRFGGVVDAIWEELLALHGSSGAARIRPWILKDLYDEELQRGGVKVRRDAVEPFRAALSMIDAVDGDPVTVHVLGVTGTMKSARQKHF